MYEKLSAGIPSCGARLPAKPTNQPKGRDTYVIYRARRQQAYAHREQVHGLLYVEAHRLNKKA